MSDIKQEFSLSDIKKIEIISLVSTYIQNSKIKVVEEIKVELQEENADTEVINRTLELIDIDAQDKENKISAMVEKMCQNKNETEIQDIINDMLKTL